MLEEGEKSEDASKVEEVEGGSNAVHQGPCLSQNTGTVAFAPRVIGYASLEDDKTRRIERFDD